ncbi:MAG: hypothetical protein FWF72_00535 [Paludibacter sp.]|nr:hypothetical protein [Paludibacter sp.]
MKNFNLADLKMFAALTFQYVDRDALDKLYRKHGDNSGEISDLTLYEKLAKNPDFATDYSCLARTILDNRYFREDFNNQTLHIYGDNSAFEQQKQVKYSWVGGDFDDDDGDGIKNIFDMVDNRTGTSSSGTSGSSGSGSGSNGTSGSGGSSGKQKQDLFGWLNSAFGWLGSASSMGISWYDRLSGNYSKILDNQGKEADAREQEQKWKKMQTMLLIGGGVFVVVIILILVFKKK